MEQKALDHWDLRSGIHKKASLLEKVCDKCKVIHLVKQPKNLLCLLRKAIVQNCIYEKYGLYRYEFKDSHCSLCVWYI